MRTACLLVVRVRISAQTGLRSRPLHRLLGAAVVCGCSLCGHGWPPCSFMHCVCPSLQGQFLGDYYSAVPVSKNYDEDRSLSGLRLHVWALSLLAHTRSVWLNGTSAETMTAERPVGQCSLHDGVLLNVPVWGGVRNRVETP